MAEFTHFDSTGASRMVDVSRKPASVREARASGAVSMSATTADMIRTGGSRKGNVLEVARLAGIMAAKRTSELIPLCHPLSLDSVTVHLEFGENWQILIEATVRTTGRTGVEMEALTAVSVACLTIYDMCKSVDRDLQIGPIRLEEKSGGASGHYRRKGTDDVPPAT